MHVAKDFVIRKKPQVYLPGVLKHVQQEKSLDESPCNKSVAQKKNKISISRSSKNLTLGGSPRNLDSTARVGETHRSGTYSQETSAMLIQDSSPRINRMASIDELPQHLTISGPPKFGESPLSKKPLQLLSPLMKSHTNVGRAKLGTRYSQNEASGKAAAQSSRPIVDK
jgi:hypothetical protein